MIFRISGLGNLGNRMMQYISASYFIKFFPDSSLANVYLPEWGIEHRDVSNEDLNTLKIMEIDDSFRSASEIVDKIKNENPDVVYFTEYLQKFFLFGDLEFWRKKFTNKEKVNINFSENEIVINIRTNELMRGLWQYPILPVEFIKKVVRETKLDPIFVGQIEENAYCNELKELFPNAKFIHHVSPLFDFEVLRRAKNSLVAISTFSFLANWLSESSKIILPIYGFFNFPASNGTIDLLPIGDKRFGFYLLPFIGGLSEAKMKMISKEITIKSCLISEKELIDIKSRFLSHIERNDPVFVHPEWYLSKYLDAAMDIAKGYYLNAKDHFLKKGIWEGRIPDIPKNEDKKNISIDKSAIISSISEYSTGKTREDQGKSSIDSSYVENYSFHTQKEYHPWLEIDLERDYSICRIEVYNRDCDQMVKERCIPLHIYSSKDKINWHLVHIESKLFGGNYNDHLNIGVYPNIQARFIKFTTPKDDCLHLKKVHIYGE
ncbi:discoidin domain-containing protein [Gluconobacter sp. Dm-62]|uniref:discoidin domain-containing protein n=1 Tax=Gluconobacter sp. Dm-62 TaxID=2799804 RepID=UPI001B8CDE19|nr:discoidin domain-containing protein [Gluconobacter sp. Dm-62]MBS1101576.1 discoidin domain-containing protein [Gluconobacter sp. Dm-62]